MTDGLPRPGLRRQAIGFGIALALHVAAFVALRGAMASVSLAAATPGSEIAARLVSEPQPAREPQRRPTSKEVVRPEPVRRQIDPEPPRPVRSAPVLAAEALATESPRPTGSAALASTQARPQEPPATKADETAPARAATRGTEAPLVLAPPRFDAAYLSNPAPAYPPLSRRLGEQGRVLLKVRVSGAGEAQAVEVAVSSGHARLDDAAQAVVRRWRFVPARRGDEAIAAWVNVPVVFKLN